MRNAQTIIDTFYAVVLAAGSSTRLGKPKQLLSYNNATFIQNTISHALECGAQEVIVVLGSNAGLIADQITGRNITIVINPGWAEGIGSSIRKGVGFASEQTNTPEGILLMVCDQPYLNSGVLKNLLEKQKQTGKPIVACDYNGEIGTPALFHRSFFPDLVNLKGDTGAKKIMMSHEASLALIPFPLGHIDIDFPSDYELLKKYSET